MARTPEKIAAELATIARSLCEPESDDEDTDEKGNASAAYTHRTLTERFLPIIKEAVEAEREAIIEMIDSYPLPTLAAKGTFIAAIRVRSEIHNG